MPQPYDRVFNFSAGPSTLPVEVLEQAKDELLNWHGSGMSVMEMSHRGAAFESIIAETEKDLRELLQVPDGYQVLFLQGGASLQFSMVPMNFLPAGGFAEYAVTGSWGEKAVESGKIAGDARVAFSAKEEGYRSTPSEISWSSNAAYAHITSNETIQGVRFASDPASPVPLVCDMSSDIFSRPVDVSKYALIYAGAQKNMGPAGATVVIVRDDFLAKIPAGLPPMLDYGVQAKNNSLYNTPPCWSIYVMGLVFKRLLATGGLAGSLARNEEKAEVLYDAIEGSGGFYKGHAAPGSRSLMNVTFTLPDEDLTKRFLKEADARKLDGLKGHRSVGGCRASIYNAFPLEGCQALADFMAEFAKA
jgi:phosphoserine aminotransferase